MDVTVTHLNNRLALQIPTELPLGLVFVVGQVSGLDGGHNGRSSSPTQFTLTEQGHRVRCVLSVRAAAETILQEGDTIRAGGHLAFDPRRADYYLRVRDVEIVPASAEAPPATASNEREALAAALAEVKKRSAISNLPQSDLPPWVRRLAPPEIRAQLEQEVGETAVIPTVPVTEETPLNDTLISRLSAAMDSEEEVELTATLLAEIAPKLVRTPPSTSPMTAHSEVWQEEMATKQPVIGYEDPDAYLPRSQRDDRLVMLLLICFIILSILIVAAIITML